MDLKEIEYHILNIIEDGKSPVGSNLLASKLKGLGDNVSAPTVGRKLADLEAAGLLVSVERKGRLLSEKGKEVLYRHHLMQNLHDAAKSVTSILDHSGQADIKKMIDLIMTRQALERTAAFLAAQYASPTEIETICTYGEILDSMLKDDHAAHSKNNQATMGRLFHETIAKAGKNELLASIIHLVNQDIAARDFLVILLEQTNYSFGLGHADIAKAIRNRDPEKAAELAAEHTQKIADALKKLL